MRYASGIIDDLRSAVRSLSHAPFFSLLALLTLAIGIGSASTVFGVVEGVLLRPLGFKHADRLVVVWGNLTREGNPRFSLSLDNARDVGRSGLEVLSSTGVLLGHGFSLGKETGAEPLRGEQVDGGFFQTLGVPAAIGRTIDADDELADARVAVLGDALWRRNWGADPGVIGTIIRLDGLPFTVIGVMPGSFRLPPFFKAPYQAAEVWTPLELPPDMRNRGAAILQVVARLRPGVDLQGAQIAMDGLASRLEDTFPESNTDLGLNIVPLHEQLLGDVRPSLLLLFGAVGFLFLISCANVVGLLLARGVGREREIAIREAIGADRFRIVRLLFLESLLLSLAGGAIAALMSGLWLGTIARLAPPDMPRLDLVQPNALLFFFALTITALVSLLVGILPAFRTVRPDLRGLLASGERSSVGVARSRLRGILATSQVSVTVVLLTGAYLMVSSFTRLRAVDPGFEPRGLVSFRFSLPEADYVDEEARLAFIEEMERRIIALPGVQHAGYANRLPLDPAYAYAGIAIEGRDTVPGEEPIVGIRIVGADYTAALGAAIERGRSLGPGDGQNQPLVAVANRTFARRFFRDGDPVGARISIGGAGLPLREVVGVMDDVVYDELSTPPEAELFIPLAQAPQSGGAMLVRASGSIPTLEASLRGLVARMDPHIPIIDVRTLSDRVSEALAPTRFVALVFSLLGGLALLLAGIGVYGVLAFIVGSRQREVGIRLALGAQRRDIAGLVLREGMGMVVPGLLAGVGVAMGLTRLLGTQLYGVAPRDPHAFAIAAALILLLAAAALIVPLRRVLRVDPSLSLRGPV